ncbi:MAG TPA: DUF3795 domain-containing protein [Armatimonadota bacterium]|nr:DUF3795 domain-containing protein [Armatimonadota bacterium]
MKNEAMMAPCGLGCSECAIHLAANDPAEADRLAEAWRDQGHQRADASWFRCQGCRGDRSVRWCEDCRIAECCVDERSLNLCSECDEFPCAQLQEWAGTAQHHMEGFARLKRLKEGAAP